MPVVPMAGWFPILVGCLLGMSGVSAGGLSYLWAAPPVPGIVVEGLGVARGIPRHTPQILSSVVGILVIRTAAQRSGWLRACSWHRTSSEPWFSHRQAASGSCEAHRFGVARFAGFSRTGESDRVAGGRCVRWWSQLGRASRSTLLSQKKWGAAAQPEVAVKSIRNLGRSASHPSVTTPAGPRRCVWRSAGVAP